MPDAMSTTSPMTAYRVRPDAPLRISDELQGWLDGDGKKTIGGLIEGFDKRAFAIIFVSPISESPANRRFSSSCGSVRSARGVPTGANSRNTKIGRLQGFRSEWA